MELVATGVELGLQREDDLRALSEVKLPHMRELEARIAHQAAAPRIAAQCFVEVEADARLERWRQGVGFYDLPPSTTDPTTALLEIAHSERELNLGIILSELRGDADYDIMRWELYSLSIRIEIGPLLYERLSGRWKERNPRPRGEPLILTTRPRR